MKDHLFHERGAEVLWCILRDVGQSTTQPDLIARILLEIMEYPDRGSRAQCLKEAMFSYGLYSLKTLPEESETWERMSRDLDGSSDSGFESDDSGYADDDGLDVQKREGTCGV